MEKKNAKYYSLFCSCLIQKDVPENSEVHIFATWSITQANAQGIHSNQYTLTYLCESKS